MTQRVGSNRIANNAITLDKIASGVLDSASDLYARAHSNSAFNHSNSSFTQANTAQNLASASFVRANNSLDANNGGTVDGNLVVTGNLTVTGNVFSVEATNLSVEDNMIYLNANNTVTNPDLGIAGNYNDGTYQHAGIFRDASDGLWKFFDSYTPEPDASPYIDTDHASFNIATVKANISTPHLSITGNTESTGYFAEKANIIASGLDADNTYLLTDGVVHYHTGVSSANANVSLTGFAEVGVGNAVSMAVIITNNVYKRYISTVEIDGTSSGVTTIWSGESAPTEGSANTDIYSFSVIKTAATPTYTVFASLNSFG